MALGGAVGLSGCLTPDSRWHYELPMTDLNDLTATQLHRIVALKEQIEALKGQIDSIVAGDGDVPAPLDVSGPKKRRMSASARAKIAAGARARWAKVKAAKGEVAPKNRRKMSASARAKIAAAQRARWARVKGTPPPKPSKKGDRRSSPAFRAKMAAAARARWRKAKAAGKKTL